MSARRGWAWPLLPLYWAGVALKNWQHRVGLLRSKRLGWPVVSVGSLSAGGAGKTPVVICLAKLLTGRGWTVDVLTRGYGREGTRTALVPRNRRNAAREFGDEPVLIGRVAEVPVWVATERYAAGVMAEATFAEAEEEQRRTLKTQRAFAAGTKEGGTDATPGRRVHLLDDGFQHRKLARAVDLVLVTAEDLSDALLPAGNLREPLGSLRRADAVVVREDEAAEVVPRVRAVAREAVPVLLLRRKLRFPAPLGVLSAGLRPIAFCAIARPEGFAAMLAEAGCGVVETVAFADHHRYTAADIERLIALAEKLSATGFVTTEKDGVKLTRDLWARLNEAGLLAVVGLEAEFTDEPGLMLVLEARMPDGGLR